MNELQRMQYLEAMGIDMYVPRFVLPGALSSSQCELPVAEPASNEAQTSKAPFEVSHGGRQQSSAPVASGELLGELLGRGPDAPPASNPNTSAANNATSPSPTLNDIPVQDASGGGALTEASAASQLLNGEPAPAMPSADTDEGRVSAREALQELVGVKPQSVSFSLSLSWTDSGILVIDSRETRQALPTPTLLANMLFAVKGESQLPKAEVLKWPMVENQMITQGIEEAREMVSAFVQGRLAAQPMQSIWLMGEDAAQALVPYEGPFEPQVVTRHDIPGLALPALILPSLSHILLNPSCKPRIWAALKAFHQL